MGSQRRQAFLRAGAARALALLGIDGLTPEQWKFYEVYGLFRLGVIAQQIYYRYFHGQTHNEAYARFGPAVAYLESRCRALVSV